MKFTVSHVVEPVERGIAKINRTLNKISENVKKYEGRRKDSKDDTYLVPVNLHREEFVDAHDLIEGSISDSGGPDGKRAHYKSKASSSFSKDM